MIKQVTSDLGALFLRETTFSSFVQSGVQPFMPYDISRVDYYLAMTDWLLIAGGWFTISPELFGQPFEADLPLKEDRTELEWVYAGKAYYRCLPI